MVFDNASLVLPVPGRLVPGDDMEKRTFARTLGAALKAGAVELMEMESEEIAFFCHDGLHGGIEIVFYETAPGGAGYLQAAAETVPQWAEGAIHRLFDHECAKACYKCLKSYRNQPFHSLLNKDAVRDVLFQLSCSEMLGRPFVAKRTDGSKLSDEWIGENAPVPTKDTVIERRLRQAIEERGRLPVPVMQREFKNDEGVLITVADFAYEEEKIAIYCDGYAYHGNKDKLATDAQKRNTLQADGWVVLTFWGKTILKYPERCEEQIWRAYRKRNE